MPTGNKNRDSYDGPRDTSGKRAQIRMLRFKRWISILIAIAVTAIVPFTIHLWGDITKHLNLTLAAVGLWIVATVISWGMPSHFFKQARHEEDELKRARKKYMDVWKAASPHHGSTPLYDPWLLQPWLPTKGIELFARMVQANLPMEYTKDGMFFVLGSINQPVDVDGACIVGADTLGYDSNNAPILRPATVPAGKWAVFLRSDMPYAQRIDLNAHAQDNKRAPTVVIAALIKQRKTEQALAK